MDQLNTPIIIVLNQTGFELAKKIKQHYPKVKIHGITTALLTMVSQQGYIMMVSMLAILILHLIQANMMFGLEDGKILILMAK